MGIGLTIVDSLDTMYIMGLHDEFADAREWVATKLSFERDHEVQLFEIVIRELGGLLSAYHLSGDKVFLDKARDLGNKLYPCLSGPTNIPCNRINLKRSRPHFLEISTAEVGTIQLEFRDLSRSVSDEKFEVLLGKKLAPCLNGLTPIPCNRINMHRALASFIDTSTAEVGSIHLEFRDLARTSRNITYEKAVDAISQHIHGMNKLDGLVACYINPHTGEFRSSSTVSVGASADSYYEYLVKQWIQTGKKNDALKNDYLEAVAGIEKHLYRHTQYSHLGFVGAYYNMNTRSFRRDMEHLACFLPGTLALGYQAGLRYENHLKMAENLTYTCYQMYARMPTGLSPEVVTMNINSNDKDDFFVMTSSAFNLQRPETIESIFYMYRVTKDPKYRQWGWKIFQAFEQYTRLQDGGYASISNVKNAKDPGYRDKMETFYLAETLKYLYLLFSDDPHLIPLDKYVINTEAHPLPIYDS
ncbi:hypothetical protein LSH36_159g03014 [Paralvinella palmiformis]|uniref:alpha-1,2-Mannosidase n=1 Tax=Paralvinella palmiformis TaxID=53620 RepID=A0AAD9JTU4_9ANNE|nr:hypothetical protein LSH36_159g03014 [Paralvinella palmiformis]